MSADQISQDDKTPFSEDTSKPNTATKEQLVADLMRLVEAEPDKVISRNYYRVYGSYAESAWTSVFGTFAEFKKQAKVVPSRHAAQLERHVAKHASTENYRRMNAEKMGWEDKYIRPDDRRFQTHVIVSDIHDIECDPFLRRVLIETLDRVQPARFINAGDLMDLPEFGRYNVDPREWDVVGRIKAAHEFLRDCRNAAPNSQFDLIEGNHEHRLLKHLAEESPAMRAVLADLHGFTVSKLLGLDQFEVNYIARSDLATWHAKDITKEIAKNYLIVDDAFLVHHFPEGQAMGYPGMHGHHHKHIVWPHFSPHFGPYTWHQLGAGHRRAASYCAGEKWTCGFMLAHVDTHKKHCVFEYVDLSYAHAVVGGRFYTREADELIEV